jgi:hypothetical protein
MSRWQVAGLAILALLPVHAMLRPEGGWALLSTCDLAAVATAIGFLVGSRRLVGTAFVFQLVVGIPALAIGMLTTYHWNITGIAIHVVPLALGGIWTARDGLPRRAALHAWLAYAASVPLAALLAPPHLNINFASVVWPPLAGTFTLPTFWVALLVLVAFLLALGELAIRFVSSRRTRARSHPRDTA